MPADFKSRLESALPQEAAGDQVDSVKPGHWHQVRAEDLLRRPIEVQPEADAPTNSADLDHPKVTLNRRQELEQHLKASPTDPEAFLELGQIYRAENRPSDARRILEQAVEIFPDDASLLWEYEEAVLARSLQQLREVTELTQKMGTADSRRELVRSQDDWAHRRMEICRARLNRDPSLMHLRIVLAEAMHDAGMHEGAIDELEPLFDNDDLSPTAYFIQGQCQLAMGNEIDAMSSLRAAALRRSVVAPIRLRIAALRLLCKTAEIMGLTLTLQQYQQQLQGVEAELAKRPQAGA